MKIIGIVTLSFSIPNLQNKFTALLIITRIIKLTPWLVLMLLHIYLKKTVVTRLTQFWNINFPNIKENKTKLITNLI